MAQHFGTRVSIKRGDELAGSAFIGPQGKIDYPKYQSGSYNIHRRAGRMIKAGRIAVATVARFLEFGTHKMGKKPFMTQAFESHKQEALEAMTDELRDAVEGA